LIHFNAALIDSPSAARHLDGAVVLDVDLRAGLLDDLADHLAARSDDFADLVAGILMV